MEVITSSSNPQIKHLRELQGKTKVRRETGTFVAEGRKLVEEACELGLVIQVYLSESYARESIKKVTSQVPERLSDQGFYRETDKNYVIVADSVFKTVSDTQTPQGILAVVKPPFFSMEELLKQETLRLLLLEDIRDPGNLGTMLRTAEGAGMDAVILSQETVDITNPKVVRSTMGSIFRVPCFYETDFLSMLKRLKENGIYLFAAHLAGKQFYDEIAYPQKAAVLIGNEARGLTEEAAKEADCYLKIPMAGKVESLNAAVAAALIMYQMRHIR